MTTCPQCHTRYSQSGEPNCWCEPSKPDDPRLKEDQ